MPFFQVLAFSDSNLYSYHNSNTWSFLNYYFSPFLFMCRTALVQLTVHTSQSPLQKIGCTPPYRNRKGTLLQNVMCASDFDLNFTFISYGWEESASDAGVLRSALTKCFHVPPGKFYLVYGGYANTPSFIAPY